MTIWERIHTARSRLVRTFRTRRAKVPTVLQMEAVECGAAAVAMVLAYFGRFVPLEELRLACGVSRDGSKASNMIKCAREYGLTARGFKKEPHELVDLPVPMVIHWNFNHFVVLEGFKGGRVFLNDPASGPRTVATGEFDQAFTGVALTFERGPAFRRGGDRRGLLPALKRRLEGSHLGLVYVVLAGLALVVPGLVVPTYTKIFVDDVLVKGLTKWVNPLLIAMGTTALMIGALVWLQQSHLLRLETKFSLSTSSRFFWHVLRLPVGFFTQRYAGEIGTRVAINDRIAQLLSGELATTAISVLLIAFYAALMFQYDLLLTMVGVSIAGLNMAALRYVSRKRVELNQRLRQDEGKLLGTAMGGLQTIETLKAMGAESDFFARWSGYQAKVIDAQQQLRLTTTLLSVVPPLLMSVATALLLGLGGLRVMDGRLSMGMLIAFQALMLSFISPVNRMVDLGSTLQEVRGDLNRLDDVLRAETDSHATLKDDALPPAEGEVKLTGHLELRDLSFGYSPLDPPLIDHFNLNVKPGRRVALVGGSGSGKSTVAKLVAGLYNPWSGDILFDGTPRQDIPRRLLTSSFAMVDQDIFLFEGTVKQNVQMWDDTLPESDVVHAATDACMHDDISARPGGYHSKVEEAGRNFSGGQAQRLEIARALVGNPSILVLDEATSAMDATTEQLIDDHLRRRGCTCLLVAHRLSTIRDCDEIIVLDKGKIVQRGTHEEMKSVPGAYSRLIAAE